MIQPKLKSVPDAWCLMSTFHAVIKIHWHVGIWIVWFRLIQSKLIPYCARFAFRIASFAGRTTMIAIIACYYTVIKVPIVALIFVKFSKWNYLQLARIANSCICRRTRRAVLGIKVLCQAAALILVACKTACALCRLSFAWGTFVDHP